MQWTILNPTCALSTQVSENILNMMRTLTILLIVAVTVSFHFLYKMFNSFISGFFFSVDGFSRAKPGRLEVQATLPWTQIPHIRSLWRGNVCRLSRTHSPRRMLPCLRYGARCRNTWSWIPHVRPLRRSDLCSLRRTHSTRKMLPCLRWRVRCWNTLTLSMEIIYI